MKKRYYNARWQMAGRTTSADVSFSASHDTNAKRMANKIARELSVTNTPRTIMCGNQLIESIQTGVSDAR